MTVSMVLAIVSTIALFALIPLFSVLYPDYLKSSRSSFGGWSTVAISGSAALAWLVIGWAVPGVASTPLFLPVTAMAGVAAFLTTIVIRDQYRPLVPAVLFTTAWTMGVFSPIAIAVFFPASVGLNPAAAPKDLGGALLVHIVAGASVLVILIVERRRIARQPPQPFAATRPVVLAALGLWLTWIIAMVGLELAIDTVTVLIVANCLIAPITASAGFIVMERIILHQTTGRVAAAGLICGLVAITPGCAYLDPLFGAFTGAVAGVVGGQIAIRGARATGRTGWFLVAAHLVCAAIGLVVLGPFILDVGLVYTGQGEAIVTQFAAVMLASLWAAGVTFALWPLTRRLEMLWDGSERHRHALRAVPPGANPRVVESRDSHY